MQFQAYCLHCEKKVSVHTMLAGNELKNALNSNVDVQVIHVAAGGDHQWDLNSSQKGNLRNQIASGLLSPQ